MTTDNLTFEIIKARNEAEIETARDLFRAYQVELDIDLCFQGFEAELSRLPKGYDFPEGELLLLKDLEDDLFVGCVALKKLEDDKCEMKRLYVKPAYRSKKYGLKLVQSILAIAVELGYKEICLDTLGKLQAAIRLYERLGFEKMEPYYDNPHKNVIYMKKQLV